MTSITDCHEWRALEIHQKSIAAKHMKDWFSENPNRFSHFSLQWEDFLFDYSKNRITTETLDLLTALANALLLPEKIHALFSAKPINATEKRPALHSALRHLSPEPIIVGDKNIMPDILAVLDKMQVFTDAIREQQWLGCTGKPIRDIVNIGIGGSHLGPFMAVNALADFSIDTLRCHFISNIDNAHIRAVLNQIDPETTIFIISSKSFTTLETITNAKTICRWWQKKLGTSHLQQHFFAVTAAPSKAIEFGIPDNNIFQLWDWVGGRYSVWSAVGLPLALMIGMKNFREFLRGGFSMDQHFRQTDFSHNMPVLMALISIWYINFFKASSSAFIPYSHYLNDFRVHLQQLEMESNGKNISHHGQTVNYATGPIIWGDQGCNGQHAFHQLLHQGQHFVPVDFVLIGDENNHDHHDILVASGLSQAQALMLGKTFEVAYAELRAQGFPEQEAAFLAPHKIIPGNRPSNILFLNKITPYNLGALLACYEHKTFVQGAIWNINSFDQWGVELGKQLLPDILWDLQQQTAQTQYDSSTSGLISHYKKIRNPA